MNSEHSKRRPGKVRDAIIRALESSESALSVNEIQCRVNADLGPTSSSSIRSYLRLNTPALFVRETRGRYRAKRDDSRQGTLYLPPDSAIPAPFQTGNALIVNCDCLQWLNAQPDRSLHAVVTDPPYGLHEYTTEQQAKLRAGKGGVWRIPPSFDGHKRSPLPRFTVLNPAQLEALRSFFHQWALALLPKTVPGANVVVASNPLLSFIVSSALAEAGFERRGEIVRLTMTMRGGDRPKAAHKEFNEVSVMPRSMWEPWLVFRAPLEGRVQDNLRKWKTGGFRRPSAEQPFGDVIQSAPTRKGEREIAPHPSLKPQDFMRKLVRAVLPLGEGVVLDPFAGAGSTLAAAEAVGYKSVGIEMDQHYFEVACKAVPQLAKYRANGRT